MHGRVSVAPDRPGAGIPFDPRGPGKVEIRVQLDSIGGDDPRRATCQLKSSSESVSELCASGRQVDSVGGT